MSSTKKLTVAQATIEYLQNQYVERDGMEQPFFAGCFGIFGHGNVAGIGQGLLLRAFDDFGSLAYTFIETVSFLHKPYVVRALGGAFFVFGMMVMAYNVFMTIRQASKESAVIEAKLAAKLARA